MLKAFMFPVVTAKPEKFGNFGPGRVLEKPLVTWETGFERAKVEVHCYKGKTKSDSLSPNSLLALSVLGSTYSSSTEVAVLWDVASLSNVNLT